MMTVKRHDIHVREDTQTKRNGHAVQEKAHTTSGPNKTRAKQIDQWENRYKKEGRKRGKLRLFALHRAESTGVRQHTRSEHSPTRICRPLPPPFHPTIPQLNATHSKALPRLLTSPPSKRHAMPCKVLRWFNTYFCFCPPSVS